MKFYIKKRLAFYLPTKKVDHEMKQWLVNSIRNIKPLCKVLGFNKGPSVTFVDNINYGDPLNDAVARYMSGSAPWPVILLGYKEHYDVDWKYICDAIEQSIVHEMLHAYLEHHGLEAEEHNEGLIEKLSNDYCNNTLSSHQILTFLKREVS
jgi:hypothetical protein